VERELGYGMGMEAPLRKPYPSDVSDDEWAFVAPYLTLMTEDAPQRHHDLRELFNGLRYVVKTGAPWRWMPNDLPPWEAVYQQSQRWLRAGCFEAIVHDLRALLRLAVGRPPEPTAVIFDGRTLQSTPESGARAGYDGHKRKKGAKTHVAVDTLGHLLALLVTPASTQERAQVEQLAAAVQEATGESVELAYVDQGYTGEEPAEAAETHGIRLEVVKHTEAKRGFVLLPRRWVVERSFAWATRFRRLVRDYERLPETLAGLHFVAFACLMLQRLFLVMERRHRNHRPEDLLLEDPHLVIPLEHRRLDIKTLRKITRLLRPLAANQHLSPLLPADIEVRHNLLHLLRRGLRPNHRRLVQRIALLDRFHALQGTLHELVIERVLNQCA